MKFFELACGTLSVFFASLAMAASVGFYAGTFDPPTQAHIGIMRCALGDTNLPKECQDFGKKISHFVVFVNDDSGDTLASTRERVLMVKKALQKYADRVEVVASTPANREERTRSLLDDKNIEQLVQFIGAASYKSLKPSPASQNPKLLWAVFPLDEEGSPLPVIDPLPANVKLLPENEEFKGISSALVQSAIKAGAPIDSLVDSGVKEVIETLGLYQDVSPDLANLQKSLFEEGWGDFLKDLKSACPNTMKQKDCTELTSQWDAVSIVTDDQILGMDRNESSVKIPLVYKKSQSEDRWAEKFSKTALKFLEGSDNYNKLKPVAEDMAARISQGYPNGKLPHLKRVSFQKKNSSIGSLKVTQEPIVCSAPQGSYRMDVNRYIADRFPTAFSRFLKDEFRWRLISPRDLYVHNHSVDEAYEFHRRDQFINFYFLQTRRGQLHRNIYLVVRSHPLAYRVVLTNVRGHDREANVLCQIHHAHVFSNYQAVQSRQAAPLFVPNSDGISLELNEKDLLLFGFKGNWTRILLAQQWQKTPLVKEGLDIDLFTHPTIKQKIVVARNVYGDDTEIVLDTFYRKGARQVIYLGTAGAIADYQIGEVVIPNEFVDRNDNSVPFQKNFALAYQSELSTLVTLYTETKHGWVQTLFDETRTVLSGLKAKSVAAVDIEGIHLGRFGSSHEDLKMAVLFVISDQTLGDSTIEKSNAQRGVIDQSVDKLASFLLRKVSNSK